MLRASEQDLICDLAETYHIFDYRSLPVSLVATLATGLRDDSRIKLLMSGEKYPRELITSAIIADRITSLQYQLFGMKNPKFLCDLLFPDEEVEKKEQAEVFSSGEEFDAAYQRIVNGGE